MAFGVFAILLIGLSYVAGTLAGALVNQQLARATAQADRDDPYWRIADLLAHRVPVADAENSAPVVVKAAALLPEVMPDEFTKTFAFLKTCQERLNAVDDDCRLGIEDVASLREARQQFAEALRIAHTLTRYTRGRFDPNLGPRLIDTPLPWLLNVRDLARLLAADSAIRAHDRDFDGALESCRAMLGAARSIGDEPFLISQLTQFGTSNEASKAIRRVLGQGEPSDQGLAGIQDRLLSELDEPLIHYGLRGERAMWVEILRRIAAGEVTIEELREDKSKLNPNRPRNHVTPWYKLYLDLQQAVMLQWMNDARKIELEPFAARAALWSDFRWRFNVPQNSVSFWLTSLPIKIFPAAPAAAFAHARSRADSGATALLIAAERHRKKTGKWPESIAAIDPAILPRPPADPYTGEPYRIQRLDGGLIVYSVGANRRDDHGEFDKQRLQNDGTDDIIARGWDVSRRGREAPEEGDAAGPKEEPSPPPLDSSRP